MKFNCTETIEFDCVHLLLLWHGKFKGKAAESIRPRRRKEGRGNEVIKYIYLYIILEE